MCLQVTKLKENKINSNTKPSTKFQIKDQLMPLQAKGQAVFPVFEVVAIEYFNADYCYICIVRQSVNGELQQASQVVPLLADQEEVVLFSIDNASTTNNATEA